MRVHPIALLAVLFALSGCPEDRKALTEEVGGAPKRQIEAASAQVQGSLDRMNQRHAEEIPDE